MKGKKKITLRGFLFSIMNKEFLIFAFFLFLSAAFWCLNALNESYETEVLVPIEVTSVPSNIVITSNTQDTLHVILRDKGFNLLKYVFRRETSSLKVNFNDFMLTTSFAEMPTANLAKRLSSLFGNLHFTIEKPEKLEFFYNYGRCKQVPIQLQGNIIPDELYYLSHVEFSPDSVTIYAPENILDSIRFVRTRPLNMDHFCDTLTLDVGIAYIRGVKCVPNTVKVTLYPDIYAENEIEVPIVPVNMPQDIILRLFPQTAKVRYVAGLKNNVQIKPEDFVVETDYNDIIADTASSHCHIILRSIPPQVTKAQLTTTEVDYLIEQK